MSGAPAIVHSARERGRSARPMAERFWEKVALAEPDQCWRWLGAKVGGYGSFMVRSLGYSKRVTDRAHRVAWRLARGPIPPGMQILHKCDVRLCVNPEHLFLGTNADNVADRVRKGRSASQQGAKNPRAVLTPLAVALIRATPGETRLFAELFGVAPNVIRYARTGKTWRHL